MSKQWTSDPSDRQARHDLAAQLDANVKNGKRGELGALDVLADNLDEASAYLSGGEIAETVIGALAALAEEVVMLNGEANLVDMELWMEFNRKDLCGLCGNTGVINTFGVRSPAGVLCGVRGYCICPNGRALKEQGTNLSHLEDGTVRR